MIATCCFPRLIQIGGRGYYLSPPSVRQAVELLHVLEHMEDEEDVSLLIELICGLSWHKRPFPHDVRIAYRNNPILTRLTLQRSLTQGYTLPNDYTEREDGGDTKSDWGAAVEAYRYTYGGDSWAVWNEVPFTYFLQQLNDMPRHRAGREMRQAIVHNPGKQTIEDWKAALGMSKEERERDLGDMLFDRLTPEEIEREKELARKQYIRK